MRILVTLFVLMSVFGSYAQEIPLGTWRTHLSFTSVSHLTGGDATVFAASDNAVMVYHVSDNSFDVYSTLNALSSTGITSICYDAARKQLLIGYEDGNLDLVSETTSVNFTRLVNLPDVGTPGTIRHITIVGNVAYLSTGYGVVLFDLVRNEIRETWRNLGAAGQLLTINQTAVLNDSIYLATAVGILKGKLTDNLLDFNQWTRFSSGDFNKNINHITVFNNHAYTAVNSEGVFYYNGTGWMQTTLPVLNSYEVFKSYEDNLLGGNDQSVWASTDGVSADPIVDEKITGIQDGIVIDNVTWLADNTNGLLSNQGGSWNSFIPNGPASDFVFNTVFAGGSVVATHGGYNAFFQGGSSLQKLSRFDQGLWSVTGTQAGVLSDIAHTADNSLAIASFGNGLELQKDNVSTVYNQDNSTLRYITDLSPGTSGIWIANYNHVESLQLLKNDMTIKTFNLGLSSARYPFAIAADWEENIWMLLAPNGGDGVLIVNKEGTLLRLLTDQPGGGLLPNEKTLSIAIDKNGYVWIGTIKGVAYYTYTGEDAIRPIVDGRYLLSEEKVTALAVDAGDRKWMGTERGVWLFSPAGEEVVYNFTTSNSPLPSNVIKDITIHEKTGEVFFTTDKGLISFRADATEPGTDYSAKIFPNPVTNNFSGLVGISEVYENATIKITDMSGKLVQQLQANGGSVSWNLADYTGKRVSTGVYLVIASARDGSDSIVGKIVVVD